MIDCLFTGYVEYQKALISVRQPCSVNTLAVADLEVKSLAADPTRRLGQVATIYISAPSEKLQCERNQWVIRRLTSESISRDIVVDE